MARYRRYRRTIVRAPKKKWGSNMVHINMNVTNSTESTTSGYHAITLAANKTESNAPTPVVVKTGNFKIQGDMQVSAGTAVNTSPVATMYIVFVPQGMEPTSYLAASSLVVNHPEWIMAWRFLESGFSSSAGVLDFERFSFSSRLKRNLNSGDSILAILLVEDLAAGHGCSVTGMCQFWTCAN